MVALLDLMESQEVLPATMNISWKITSSCFFPMATFVNTLNRDHGEHTKHIQETNAKNMLYFFEYMIYTHFSVIIPFCWPNTHNSPIKSWPTHQFHLKLFSRGAAAAFRAFGRKLPQNSTWSGQNGLLAKKKKSLFAGTTCKGCRFVKVGWFWDVWFVKGDEGWMIDDFWICPKAPQLGGYIYI